MTTINEVLAHLPPQLAHALQLKLEDAALGNHLTEDETKEIIDGIFHQVAIEQALDEDEVARNIDYFTAQLRDALLGLFF